MSEIFYLQYMQYILWPIISKQCHKIESEIENECRWWDNWKENAISNK